ncbi:MAG: tetratricopeptide repeat protein [Desulfobacterales bacterium]|nr:tetratricopeptide repeat protein [Desulfobacterales bacterium]
MRKKKSQMLLMDKLVKSALDHHRKNDFVRAKQLYKEVLKADPKNIDANYLYGTIAHQEGEHKIAIRFIKKALSISPKFYHAHNNLGIIFKATNQLGRAIKSYKKALAIKPDFAEAHNNLGNALKEANRFDEAITCYKKAVSIKPDYADAYNNLGKIFNESNRLDEAISYLKKALEINPEYSDAHNTIARSYEKKNDVAMAISCYQRAVQINPRDNSYWANLAHALMKVEFTSCDEKACQLLIELLDRRANRPVFLAKPILNLLRCHVPFSEALKRFNTGEHIETKEQLITDLSDIPLFIRLMSVCPIPDIEVEHMLTRVRNILLDKEISQQNANNRWLSLYIALSMQCFINEYVFFETENEKQKIATLQERISNHLSIGDTISSATIAIFSSYRPLNNFSWSNSLLADNYTGDIRKIIKLQVEEGMEENALKSKIQSFSPITDNISISVKNQYEKNPYPRWIKTNLHQPAKIKTVLKGLCLHPDINKTEFSARPEILVAGCGTGQNALSVASRFLNSNVLAIDLSFNSLGYAIRKTRELGISNIQYMQGDILEVKNLNKRFDMIESSGVLHHMEDPLSGWKSLVGILKPGGLMKIGLYSETARQSVVEIRKIIAQKKLLPTTDRIQKFRKKLIESKTKESMNLIKTADFFSTSECRDLLFHIQEHRFRIPQIETVLKDLGLNFLGFEIMDDLSIQKFLQQYPEKNSRYSLPLWNAFELANPHTFRGMYQFWLQKR